MTATAPFYVLEHEAALTPGRVVLRQGPRSTIVTEADLIDLLKRVKRTGTVRRAGVALDESQLVNLYDTYFPDDAEDEDVEPDIDPDRFALGLLDDGEDPDMFGPNINEHGVDMTPGYAPRWAGL